MNLITLEEFKELIEDFVFNNFRVRSRDENAVIIIDDFKGSYDKSIKELFEELKLTAKLTADVVKRCKDERV